MRRFWACCVLAGVAAALLLPSRAEALWFDTIGYVSGDYVRYAAVQGHYLFRTTQDERAAGKLTIHDMSVPDDPELVAAFDLGHFAYSFVASPTLAVAGCLHELRVLDISNPEAPLDYGTFPLAWIPQGLALQDGKLYVADYDGGLLVVDISHPASPLLLGARKIDGYANKVAVAGQYAAVSDNHYLGDRLHIIDVSDPAAPVEVGLWQSDSIEGIATSGHYVLVVGGVSLHVIDIRKPSHPREVATYTFDNQPFDIAVSGNQAVVQLEWHHLMVLDISDPTSPVQQASFPVNPFGVALAVSGTQALLVGTEGQVLAVDLASLQKLYEIPRLDPVVSGFKVATAAGHAYVTGESLSVVDLRNPAAPVKVAAVPFQEVAAAVIARGDYLYLTEGRTSPSFSIYELSDPDHPKSVGVLNLPSGASPWLALSGEYAYVGGGRALKVIDVSQPSAPVEIGTSGQLPGYATCGAVAGGYAYVGTSAAAGLQIVDVSDPQHPSGVGGVALPGNSRAVALSGSLAFVACGAAGVRVVDVSDPASPVEVAVLDLPATDLTVLGSHLYTDIGVIGISDLGGDVPAGNGSLTSASTAFWDGNVISVRGGLAVWQPLITFSDTPLDHWALDAIERCAGMGIVAGYPDGSYRPGITVTRDQMAVYISRAAAGGDANVPTGPATATFSDVATDSWAYKHIEYAHAQGVVQGYGDGTYGPTISVDRGQMAVFIARAIAGGESSVPPGPETPHFPDVGTDFWAYKHIEYIADPARAVTQGYPDGKYHPEYICTRDQTAVFVQRAFRLPPM